MTGQAAEVAVPMDRDKVGGAIAIAGFEEVGEPGEAGVGARDGGRAKLHPELAQRFELADPSFGGECGLDVGAAGLAGAVGLVEGHNVADVCATDDLSSHVGIEGEVRSGNWGTPEHGHKLESRVILVDG